MPPKKRGGAAVAFASDVGGGDSSDEAEEYDESADADFNPDEAGPRAGDASSSSSSDDDDDEGKTGQKSKGGQRGRKRKALSGDAAADDDNPALDSGDEATIRERARKRRKARSKQDGGEGDDDVDDSDGGPGGLIKTRAQRQAEQTEKKQRRRHHNLHADASLDVDALWAELSALPVGRDALEASAALAAEAAAAADNKENIETTAPSLGRDPDALITVKRRIEYAGEVTEVTARVARSSKEGQRWLASHPEADNDGEAADEDGATATAPRRRPLRRPSLFEPNPTGTVKGVAADKLRRRAPGRADVQAAAEVARRRAQQAAQRLTTVQKSALDWAGFVEGQTGLREELDEYGKSRRGFLAREAFLDRAQGARDEAAREARMKG